MRSIVSVGDMKIGHVSISFVDMVVPVAGFPVQVIRSYDSRDKRLGDFGVGWRLSTKDVNLKRTMSWENIGNKPKA